MLNYIKEKVKAIAKDLAVAFFFTTFTLFLTGSFFDGQLNTAFSLINKFAVKSFNTTKTEGIKINKISKRLEKYPYYGEGMGGIKIPSVGIDLALYNGEALEILRYGAGHHAGSFYPGEGGTIIIAGHNIRGHFYTLPQVNIGDKIILNVTYGTYTYEVTKTEIRNAVELGENLHLRRDEEELMLYTCYPVETPGWKADRFVVYAKLVGEEDV